MSVDTNTKCLSRSDVIRLIAEGKAIVIYEDRVLNLTKWLPTHPGGEKAVLHMIGRDATDEMNAYHEKSTVATFKRWTVGRIKGKWDNLIPPIQGADYSNYERSVQGSLDRKLDAPSTETSDADLELTTTSESSVEDFDEKKHSTKSDKQSGRGLGLPKGKVQPKIPEGVIVSATNVEQYFPVNKDSTVVDPQILMNNYDHALSQNDILNLPSLDYETQRNIRKEYETLHETLTKNNFYQCDYWCYVRELIKIASMMLYAFSFFKLGYLKLSAIFLGLSWQQMTFIGHDAGHVSITHNYQIDNVFGILIADWFGGLSLGWWKRNHNVHHLVTNDPVHDPDIQHLPFFAVSVRFFESVYSTFYEFVFPYDGFAKFVVQFQNYLYYPILCFGRFNLYRLSWTYLILGQGPRKGKAAWFRYLEIAGLSFFFYWYCYLMIYKGIEKTSDRAIFMMTSNIASMIVHVQITLSHFAMSTTDLGSTESFPMRQIRTTMDVDCPEWFDFFHGGLQFQAIHHLFPRMPRHNLRRAQPFVIDFCKKVGLKYSIYGFGEGNGIVLDKLADIGKQAKILLEASKKIKENDEMIF